MLLVLLLTGLKTCKYDFASNLQFFAYFFPSSRGRGGGVGARMSSKQTKIYFGLNRNKPKQDLFRVCFGVSNLYRNNRKKQNCFVTNRNNPKCSEKYPNILSFKLFDWVSCLFQFNRNIETLCFGIEAKQPKQTDLKQTEKTEKNEKNEKKTKKPEKTLNFL
jgi:hypothetical protein